MDEMYRKGRLRPDPSTCTSIKSTDEKVTYCQLLEQHDHYTCAHADVEVTFRVDTDDDTQIWYCAQFRSLDHNCMNAI